MFMLPSDPAFRATLRTSILAWLVLRGVIGLSGGSLSILPPTSLLLMLGVAAIALVDSAVSRERLFLGNLGFGRRAIAGVSLAVTATLEIVAALAIHALDLGG
jgi:hypothetical protein